VGAGVGVAVGDGVTVGVALGTGVEVTVASEGEAGEGRTVPPANTRPSPQAAIAGRITNINRR
jgi:hypothetical protein